MLFVWFAESCGGTLYHYRDNSGLEIDAIIEMRNGAWGAFEIKLGEHQVDNAVKSLLRLRDKTAAAGAEHPVCLCVVTGGGYGRKREDGIYVIPVNAFAP